MQAQGFSTNFVPTMCAFHITQRRREDRRDAHHERFLPEGDAAVQRIFDHFQVRKVESNNFRFCGKAYVQDDEYCVTVAAKDNTERLVP